ncbi:hypothetical protein AB0K80_15975 [Streptomyces sp. NPDC052682]|uniref:hypothetical protein n=1 Tax=Streptomyces sp. NPDC052682 TaxID=3154954 RepID=UPI0034383A21
MLILGLLLVAGSAAFTVLLIAGNLSGGPEYTVSVLGNDLVTLNTLAVFCSGLALALVFCLGLAMMTTAAARRRHRHRGPRRRGREDTVPLDEMMGPDNRA